MNTTIVSVWLKSEPETWDFELLGTLTKDEAKTWCDKLHLNYAGSYNVVTPC
mgnify:CR=1 FL=1